MKRIISTIILTAACVTLCACGNNGQGAPAASTSAEKTTSASSAASELSVTPEESAESETSEMSGTVDIDETDCLRGLEWGMSADRVKEQESAQFTGKEFADINGVTHTLLRYGDVPFLSYTAALTFYATDDKGLVKISYKVTGDEKELFDSINDVLSPEYEGEGTYGRIWTTNCIEKDTSVILIPYDGYVICSFLPLMSSDERQKLNTFETGGGIFDDNGGHALEPLLPMTEPEYDPESIACEPVDRNLDLEHILLDRAHEIQVLYKDFLCDGSSDAFELGEWEHVDGFPMSLGSCPVISDDIKTVDDIKSRFNKSIYEGYTEKLMYHQYGEANGKLYRLGGTEGGRRGTESWYIGCDIEDDKVVGHFVILGWAEEDITAEFINDETHYDYYDIVMRNIDGQYLITNVVSTEYPDWDNFKAHGFFYDIGVVDRSLITNDAIKPLY